MNKELILKYKKEFEHWLNGGEILVQTEYHKNWYLHTSDNSNIWELTCSVKIIINDEYSIYRKALAEGKTIQCNAREDQTDITYAAFGHTWWVDTTEFKYATSFYRIKPEEPQFKVDDLVEITDKSNKYTIMNTNELNQKIANMEAELTEMKALLNEPTQTINYWQPSSAENYYYVDQAGKIKCDYAGGAKRYRVFKTEAEAEKYAEYIKAEETLRKAIAEVNEGWLPNWNARFQNKYGFDLVRTTI